MRHSAKKSTCNTQLFLRSHPRKPRGGWCEHWQALWGSFGAVRVGYAPTPFHGNPREGKGVNPFPLLLSLNDNRVWRSPALARTAARDRALATGPVGMIDLTTLRSIGCRLDV